MHELICATSRPGACGRQNLSAAAEVALRARELARLHVRSERRRRLVRHRPELELRRARKAPARTAGI